MDFLRSRRILFALVFILVVLTTEFRVFKREEKDLLYDTHYTTQRSAHLTQQQIENVEMDKKTSSLWEELARNGRLSPPTASTTTIDVVIPFDGELSPMQLGLLLRLMKGKQQEIIGLVPQWNEQLRLTLRSLQKHLVCVPRSTSRLTLRTIHILVRSGSTVPSWLHFGRPRVTSSHTCEGGSLDIVNVKIVFTKHSKGAAYNHFAMESQITAIPSLAPHFLYLPVGTVFTRPVKRDDLFGLMKGPRGMTLLFPRVTQATEIHTPTTAQKRVNNRELLEQVTSSHDEFVRKLHNGTAHSFTPPVLNGVHVVNTFLFTHYASGHSITSSSSPKLRQLSQAVKDAMSRSVKSVSDLSATSPLLLHEAAVKQALVLGHETSVTRTLRHHTIQCWSSRDAIEALKHEYAGLTNHSAGESPLTLRLMPVLRHPFWMEQFLWEREMISLSGHTREIAEIMGLTASEEKQFYNEKRDIEVPPAKKMLYKETYTYPEPQDPISHFPCGPLRARLNSTSLPSPGVVSDLLRAEPSSSPRTLPPWDAPEASTSAAAVTIATMQCWYPGRPPHLKEGELPQITANPPLKKRVGSWARSRLEGHDNETANQSTVQHHRLATIDIVYTYVKGDAPNWLKKLRVAEAKKGIPADDNRIRDWDELRYSLRSVEKFVCRKGDCCGQESGLGIGAIYIVMATEEHIPEWLTGYKVGTDGMDEEREAMSDEDKQNCRPPLRIITHEMIFPGAGNNPRIGEHTKNPELQAQFLPTFNSNAIESCLHRIPGLRSHYVYLNNDFLFGRNVLVNDFFRPVLHEGQQLMLEPLIAVEDIAKDLQEMGANTTHTEPSPEEREMESMLFHSDPKRYAQCRSWPIRRGVTDSLQAKIYRGINQWTLTKHYNAMLVLDRLEGMPMTTKHAHVAMMFHRDTVHKMLEVDFADIAYQTRVGKFREIEQIAPEVMYIFYAFAHRRARGSLTDPAFCLDINGTGYPHPAMYALYQRWNHDEPFEIDQKWGYHWFYQVHEKNIDSVLDDVKSGVRPLTTFVSINDNFGSESDEKYQLHFRQFSELMNLLVSNAPASWFEAPK